MLSALLGNVPGVGVVQDLCLLYYLKQACLQVLCEEKGIKEKDMLMHSFKAHSRLDLRATEFIYDFLRASPVELLNSPTMLKGKILRRHISLMDEFLFTHLNIDDPRKDRGQGASYLKSIDFGKLLKYGSMVDAYNFILESSATPLSGGEYDSIDLICDKTPENLISLDLIELCSNDVGYYFLHLVRDPVAIFGSRRQRVDISAEMFSDLFAERSMPLFEKRCCIASSVVRYEDLLVDSSSELVRVFGELKLHQLASKATSLSEINPGKYKKYVGKRVDPARNASNIAQVSEAEREIIYQKLSGYCQAFGYGPCSV